MGFDVSSAEDLATDLLNTSDDYRPHDPRLADELLEKAHEICRTFGIDSALFDGENLAVSGQDVEETQSSVQEPVTDRDHESDDIDTSDSQLQSILISQRRVIDLQIQKERQPPSTERRSSRSRRWAVSNLVRLETA